MIIWALVPNLLFNFIQITKLQLSLPLLRVNVCVHCLVCLVLDLPKVVLRILLLNTKVIILCTVVKMISFQ